MIETEAKIKLTSEDKDRILAILGEPKFISQENTFYKIGDKFARVRLENNQLIVNTKGKKENDKFGSRKEIEFSLDKGKNNVHDFFLALGIEKALFYKKQRANFHLNNCTISMDILPEENYYLEIEGNEKDIEIVMKNLKLNNHALETKSYAEIMGATI